MIIGILSFQGDFHLHKVALNKLGVENIFVNSKKSLMKTDALIIPGGESSVLTKFLKLTNLDIDINNYASEKNVFGTCAGSIIMSNKCDDKNIALLKLIDIKAKRNKWGRQVHSFETKLNFNLNNKVECCAKFIRAPKIKVLSNNVKILAQYKNEPVLVRNKKHLACTFHPEMSKCLSIHKYFIEMINE